MNLPGKVLIQGIGNPARGDDAVGPLFVQRLRCEGAHLEWVYQLQIENAEQWSHYDTVVVVDAHTKQSEPYVFSPLHPSAAPELSTHSVSPDAVLALNRAYFSGHPRVYLLSLQGENFELGAGLSSRASVALDLALRHVEGLLEGAQSWPEPAS